MPKKASHAVSMVAHCGRDAMISVSVLRDPTTGPGRGLGAPGPDARFTLLSKPGGGKKPTRAIAQALLQNPGNY